MIKKIERPDWEEVINVDTALQYIAPRLKRNLERWFNKHIEPINRALDGAVEVYANHGETSLGYTWTTKKWAGGDTHKAFLINIEPLKQETCADVLKEWVDACGIAKLNKPEVDIFMRAKAALERESDE